MRNRTLMLVMLGELVLIELGPAAQANDRAREAMRHEAEAAAAAAHERAFQNLKALPLPPAPVRQIVVNPIGAGWGNIRFVSELILQPVESKAGEADGDLDANRPRFEVADDSFDFYVFGARGESSSAQLRLEKILDFRLRQISAENDLSAPAIKKLSLAGRGDIKRLMDRVDEAQKTFQSLKTDVDRCADYLEGLISLRRDLVRGPFGPQSLLQKTLQTLRDRS